MSGISASSGAPAARLGLESAIRAAFADEPEVDVYAGFQWPTEHDDWVALGDVQATRDPRNIGPRRQVDETITLEVNFGAWRAGRGNDVAAKAWARAYALLATVEAYLLQGDHPTLGGVVLWCLPGDANAAGDEFDNGYQVEIAATFICSHRVRAL
ncbi:hypothetical protein [Microbacterium arborescens]